MHIKNFDALTDNNCYTFFPVVYSACGRKILLENNREVLNFGSCDYLGLSNDSRLKEAAKNAIDLFGTNISGSVLMSGYTQLHQSFEQTLSMMYEGYNALMFTTSFLANLGTIPFIVGAGDIAILDKLSHSCLIQGALLSNAKMRFYSHNNMNELEELLIQYKDYKKVVISDGVFSADGDLANIKKIVELCKKYNSISYIDDAHGVGILGINGCGIIEHEGMLGQVDIVSGTMSKAFGSTGGFILLKDKTLYHKIRHTCHLYTGSRAVSPGVVGASLKALEINKEEGKSRRKWALELADKMNLLLKANGFETLETTTTIIPIIFGDFIKTGKVTQKMLDRGFLTSHFLPPFVEKNTARLRVGITYNHTEKDINDFIETLIDVTTKC